MNKPPAFQFYAADFLVDAAVKLMTLEERGAYVTLLAHAWIEGPLPGAIPKLARLCEVSVADMERIWPAVAPCWVMNAGGFIVNPRLEKERRKQAQYRKAQSNKALTRLASSKPAGAELVPSSPSSSLTLTSESKTKSGASAPILEQPLPEQRNPMQMLGPLIREHLYRGKPAEGYDTRRCAHVCKTLLATGRYTADDLRDAILTVPLVRAGKVTCDESFRRFFLKHASMTMLVLNDRWGSGLVLDQLLHLALKAESRRPATLGLPG